MIKTGKNKTQATTVVHEGKVYKGVMPNLNMKTDLTGSFEYIATIVEGMSSGNQNGNPIYDDFKKKIIEWTISGEVGKLVNERGHVPENYEHSPHLGRYSSQIGALGRQQVPDRRAPEPIKASDVILDKLIDNGAIEIDMTDSRNQLKRPGELTMVELQHKFDEYEELLNGKEHKASVMKAFKIAKEYEDSKTKKKVAKKKTKKKVAKKKTKKKVAKRRSAKKD